MEVFLRVLRDSAPFVCMVNMPLSAAMRVQTSRRPWREIEQLCRERGMRRAIYDGIPDDGFLSKTHFNARGHRLMAEKLNEVLP